MVDRVEVNSEEFERALKADARALARHLGFAFGQIGLEFVSRGQGRIRGEYMRGAQGPRLYVQNRSGALRRDGLRFTVRGEGTGRIQDLVLGVFITKPYGALQEFGGTVRPKSARALTIPMEANLDPSGIMIMSASEWRATGETFVWNSPERKSAGRPGFIARKVGAGGLELLFVFASQVKVPARWGLRGEWRSSSMAGVRSSESMAAVRRALRGVA